MTVTPSFMTVNDANTDGKTGHMAVIPSVITVNGAKKSVNTANTGNLPYFYRRFTVKLPSLMMLKVGKPR